MSRRGRPAVPARGREAAPPAPPARARTPRWLEIACLLSPLAAAAALGWSLRGAPLGTPVADDWEFLHRVVFGHDTGLLGSMGATWYWRPLSRQVWFPLVAPLLLAAPAAVAAIHAALLGATAFLLARLARRAVPRPAAALVAAAVLATEPARALVTWPSGIQHLLAALALALTAHESAAGRRWSAALAALAAALAHDLGAAAFALLAAGGLLRRDGRGAWRDAATAAALALLWALGYRAALGAGVQLPAGGAAQALAAWPRAIALGADAAFGAEGLAAPGAALARTATLALFALGLGGVALAARRESPRALAALAGGALALAWLGIAPLASLLPDWNAWRAFVPAIALVFAVTLVTARAHLALGLALVAVRLAALAFAAPASHPTGDPPPAVSDLSFTRLARMQQVVAASGAIVRAAPPGPGGRVAFLGLPELTLNGFGRDLAAQVWTRDTAMRFVPYAEGAEAREGADLVLSYDTRPGRPVAAVLSPEARRWWRLAGEATDRRAAGEAREYYLRALAAQRPESPSLTANALQNLALQELQRGGFEAADSLNRAAYAARGATPEWLAIDALLALVRGEPGRARALTRAALRLSPENVLARAAAAEVERAAAQARGAAPPAP